jgi:hypothetical protein
MKKESLPYFNIILAAKKYSKKIKIIDNLRATYNNTRSMGRQ